MSGGQFDPRAFPAVFGLARKKPFVFCLLCVSLCMQCMSSSAGLDINSGLLAIGL